MTPNSPARYLKSRLQPWLRGLVKQKWFDVGLRSKMSLMVTIGLAGLVAIFIMLGSSATRQATHQVLGERVMLARMTATTMDAMLMQIELMLAALGRQPVLLDPAASVAEKEAVLHQTVTLDHWVFLLNENGERMASSHSVEWQVNWNQIGAVRKALAGADLSLSVISMPGNDQNTSPMWAVMAAPLRQNSGQVVGVLAALLNLNDQPVFPAERSFELGQTGTLDVVDASGQVLISTHPERVLMDSSGNDIISELFIAGEPGVETCLGCYENETPTSQDEVVAFAPLSRAPWGVVVRQKAEEVFAPVRRLMLMTLALGAITVAGALVLVWITTSSVIKPVQSLTKAALRIAGGDLNTPIRLNEGSSRTDEIGALTESFITMRTQLKRSIDEIQAWNRELDARVRERTQAALEAQLEAQGARDDLRAVIDSLSDELIVVGVEDHCVQQANQAAVEHSQIQGELIGKACYEVFHCGVPCTPPDCDCPITSVLTLGEAVKVTHIHPGKDHQSFQYVDIVASPMRSATGEITRVVELSRDVTEEKRIKESLVRRNQQLAILNAVAMTVNQSLNLEDILGRALDEVIGLTGIDVGAVFLMEDGQGDLKLMAYRGLSKDAANLAAQVGMLDSGCGGVIETSQVVIVPDLSRYRGRRARSLLRENLSTLVHIPLTAKGCTLGSMCVGTHLQREFGTEEQELLRAIGSQIAVAIENARLYAEVQHKEHIRGELFKKVIAVQEDERKRIARELHDDTSQALTALLFAAEEGLEMEDPLEIKKRLDGMHSLIQCTLDGVHKLIFDLRPSILDHLGLVSALRWFATTRLESRGIRVSIEEASPPRRLPPEMETALFRVVQEAITNIARHAAARNVAILLKFDEESVTVRVEDDGVGFDLTNLTLEPDSMRGLGLAGMQERVELLGGEVEVNTVPGFGTQVHIHLPLKEKEPDVA